ncbi:MAG: hypothetical protein ACFN0X_08905 [Mitsuokella sp.]
MNIVFAPLSFPHRSCDGIQHRFRHLMDRLQQGFGIHVLIRRHEERKPYRIFCIHPKAREHDTRRTERSELLLRCSLPLCKLRAGRDDALLRRAALR